MSYNSLTAIPEDRVNVPLAQWKRATLRKWRPGVRIPDGTCFEPVEITEFQRVPCLLKALIFGFCTGFFIRLAIRFSIGIRQECL